MYKRRTYAATDEIILKAPPAATWWARSSPPRPARPPLIEATVEAPDQLLRMDVVKDGKYVYTTRPDRPHRHASLPRQRRQAGQIVLLRARVPARSRRARRRPRDRLGLALLRDVPSMKPLDASTFPRHPARHHRRALHGTRTLVDAGGAVRPPFLAARPSPPGAFGLAAGGIVLRNNRITTPVSAPTPAARSSASCSPSPPKPPAWSGHGGRETILVVEDEPATLKISRILLESWGYRVIEAQNSPPRPWTFSKNTRSDIRLVLTDVVMPGMTGPELGELLNARKPELRIALHVRLPRSRALPAIRRFCRSRSTRPGWRGRSAKNSTNKF